MYDGEMIEPQAAWEHFTRQGHASVGVLPVTHRECKGHELAVDHDGDPFPERVSVDLSGLSSSQTEKVAKKLKKQALAKGWAFREESV